MVAVAAVDGVCIILSVVARAHAGAEKGSRDAEASAIDYTEKAIVERKYIASASRAAMLNQALDKNDHHF